MKILASVTGARRLRSTGSARWPALGAAIACAVLSAAPANAPAQVRVQEVSGPVLRLDAQTSREVVDDTAYAVFFVEREGPKPAAQQSEVNAVLQSALATLKSDGALRVRTGNYTTFPRYSRDGRIDAWRVRAELVAESGDPAAISRASVALSGRMSIASIGFRLSPELRQRTEKELTGEAAANFYDRARGAARALGFGDIELVEANFGTGSPSHPVPLARAMAGAAPPADAAPVPMEPGRSTVTVTFSGTVRLRP